MRKAVFLLLLSAGICLPSCQPDTPSSPSFESSEIPSFPSSSEPEKYDYAQIEETTIRLRNSSLNATFQKNTGFLNSLSDKNGNLLKKQGIGSWPLEIVTDDGATAKIAQDGKNKVSSFHVEKGDHEETLRFQYEELLDETGRGLGIACETRFSLGETSFLSFSFSLTLSENAPSIDKVYCLGDGICAPDKDGWVLTAPIWNGGEQWSNPMENASFKKGVTLAYPGRSQATLEAGWFDLSSASGGLGIGLIDRKQMSNEFLLKANDASLSLRSALFEPTQLLGEDDDLSLKPGESFSSDSYFLAVHENDWHETADIYRKLYESSFAGEFLTKETLSSKAKNAPFVYRAIAGWNTGTVDEHELAYTTFEKMEKDLKTFKEGALREGDELDLEGMLFWLTGQNTQGYAFDVPMMTPILPQSGGETGLMALTQHLHEQGANIFQYEHPFAVDPDRLEEESPGLLAKVDPNQHTEHWDACTHHAVCIDNSYMQDFWSEKVLPPIAATHPDGLMLDQCPLVQTVCNLEGHNHGLSAEERLSSHAHGLFALQEKMRSSLEEDNFLVCEASNDILTRNVDVHQQCWHGNVLWNGELIYTAGQYTHPEFVYHSSAVTKLRDSVSGNLETFFSTLMAAASGGIVELNSGEAASYTDEYIRAKQLYSDAPGYPFGFKDNVGLTVSSEDIFAKVFTDGESLSVTYALLYHVKNETIEVDLSKFGGTGKRTIAIDGRMNTCGLEVIPLR